MVFKLPTNIEEDRFRIERPRRNDSNLQLMKYPAIKRKAQRGGRSQVCSIHPPTSRLVRHKDRLQTQAAVVEYDCIKERQYWETEIALREDYEKMTRILVAHKEKSFAATSF